MPDAQPAEISPAAANAAHRAAIESQSAKALREAIETVSVGEPEAKPEAQANPDEAEPTETPKDAPETKQEAEPPKPIKASAALERQARKTIQARKAAQEAKAANERAAAAEQRAAQASEEAKAARELLDLLKADPMVALTKVGHDPARLVPDWLKKVAEPEKTTEQKAAEAAQAEIEKLKKWQEQQELAQRNQALTSQIATYQGQCAEAIADKDAFEYVHRDGGTEALYRYITDTYELAAVEAKSGRLTQDQLLKIATTPPALYAKQMEAELRGKFGPKAAKPGSTTANGSGDGKPPGDGSLLDAARSVRGSKSLKQKQKAKPVEEDDEPRSPRGGGIRTVPFKKPFNQQDLIQSAIRAQMDAEARVRRR